VYVVHCILFWWMFGLNSLPIGGDGYFHYTIASQLSFSNPVQSIEALPFTLLGEQGPDHHWLIHWLQKPLTALFADAESGVAIATIVWAALVPAFLCAIMRLYQVPYAPLIAVIGVWGLYLLPDRLLMFRAQNAAIVLLAMMALLMSAQRYVWVAIFIFFFNHAYQGVVLAGAIGLATLLAHGAVHRKFDRVLISASIAGLILSLLVSPWFPDNIRYFLVMMMSRLVSPLNNLALMGAEWLPLGPVSLLKLGLVGHISLTFAWIILGLQWRSCTEKIKLKRALTFTIFASLLLILYARHWRMGEFYGPISAMAFGFCLTLLVNRGRVLVGLIVLAVFIPTVTHQYVKKPIITTTDSGFNAHCQYLNSNTRPGDMVFNLPWSVFPYLYHCAPQLKYISGLDGLMLSQGDPEVFRVWYYLYRGYLDKLDSIDVTAVFTTTRTAFVLLEPNSSSVMNWILAEVSGSRVVLIDDGGILISLEHSDQSTGHIDSVSNRFSTLPSR